MAAAMISMDPRVRGFPIRQVHALGTQVAAQRTTPRYLSGGAAGTPLSATTSATTLTATPPDQRRPPHELLPEAAKQHEMRESGDGAELGVLSRPLAYGPSDADSDDE